MTDRVFRKLKDKDVKCYDCTGDAIAICETARISYNSGELVFDPEKRDFIEFLIKNNHWVPFEHCVMTFRINAPIFVFRQLFRYRTAAISERSLRYTEAEPSFCIPLDMEDKFVELFKIACNDSFDQYLALVHGGVKKEVARSVLPVSMFSKCFLTINARNLIHMFDQRIDDHAQSDTRFIVEHMYKVFASFFDIVAKALENTRNYQFKYIQK